MNVTKYNAAGDAFQLPLFLSLAVVSRSDLINVISGMTLADLNTM